MNKANIKAIRPKKRHYYPNTGKLHKRADNLLDRDFNQTNSNTHWVGDITYIKTYQGWSYLASVLDLASRQVVGWALSKQSNSQLAQDAMDMCPSIATNTLGVLLTDTTQTRII